MNKIYMNALRAKELGFKYMYSIIKNHFNTTYYHVVSVDLIIAEGKWIPANFMVFASGARGRYGVSKLPPNSVYRLSRGLSENII